MMYWMAQATLVRISLQEEREEEKVMINLPVDIHHRETSRDGQNSSRQRVMFQFGLSKIL